MSMNEIAPGLWLGDIVSAYNTAELKRLGVRSVITAMRGQIAIHPTFISHQIPVNDEEDADLLSHLVPAVSFIASELGKGRGVLVHCHAGVSRSATIVAAYLMYSRNMDAGSALDLIRTARPQVSPNDGFLRQLELFYQASFDVSKHDKTTRMFYLERAVHEVTKSGRSPSTDILGEISGTSSSTQQPLPDQSLQRRIRCKMCRQELAAREHMLGHGNIETYRNETSPTAISLEKPLVSPSEITEKTRGKGTSLVQGGAVVCEHDNGETLRTISNDVIEATASSVKADSSVSNEPYQIALTTKSDAINLGLELSDSLGALEISATNGSGAKNDVDAHAESSEGTSRKLASSPHSPTSPLYISTPPRPGVTPDKSFVRPSGIPTKSASSSTFLNLRSSIPPTDSAGHPSTPSKGGAPTLVHPRHMSAQLLANPQLAALRMGSAGGAILTPNKAVVSPPILTDNKCSGYFVEPLKWMEPFLESGELAGKITCPNKKCGAKLGNFDWAGVRCSCKEWVVPGFCIHRSKVDEFVV